MPAVSAPSRLILSPTTALAQPRGWSALASPPSLSSKQSTTYDEVHCVGGGSLLLWLLACAGRAPRGRIVYMHGPVVQPTPESCAAWLVRESGGAYSPDKYEWRTQAVALGLSGGGLPPEDMQWLRPLLTSIASGRGGELGSRFADMQKRWERNGRLVHRPLPQAEDALLSQLLQSSIDESRAEEACTLLRCSQTGCASLSVPMFADGSPSGGQRTADVVFLCPPVGWQHVNMGRALFEENTIFERALRECEQICERDGLLPRPLLEVLYPTDEDEAACAALLETPLYIMPSLFAVEYALVAMCEGHQPFAVIGHSIGEYVSAVVAGVLDLPTAMALVCERGRAMEETPSVGSMISLKSDVATACSAIESAGVGDRVSIACINGQQSVVIGGDDTSLAQALDALPLGTKSAKVTTSGLAHIARTCVCLCVCHR